MKPFGIFLPAFDENYFYFTNSNVTADLMVDAIEDLWPIIKASFNPHTIAINADNGPENNSRRTQFMKRLVAFRTGQLEPIVDALRICVAHGMVDNLCPNPDDPAIISLHAVESAI